MTPIFKVDYPGFKGQMMDLAFASRREFRDVVREQAKLTAFDLIKTTPPNDSQPINESFNIQRKKGEAAIHSDVTKLFQPLDSLKVFSAPRSRRLQRGQLRNLASQGKWQELSDELFALQITDKKEDVVGTVDEKSYLDYKGTFGQKQGRLKKEEYPRKLVFDGSAIVRLVNELRDRVGLAKSGWMKAANALGVQRIPSWITRHNGSGSFVDDSANTDAPVITMFNNVRYIQYLNKYNRLLNRALRNRRRAMEISTEKAIEHFTEKFKG